MVMRLNREAYAKLIAENITWLDKQPRSLEREHIRQILLKVVEYEYGPAPVDESWPPPAVATSTEGIGVGRAATATKRSGDGIGIGRTSEARDGDTGHRLTAPQIRELRAQVREPQSTYGAARVRVQNNLVQRGLSRYAAGSISADEWCEITEKGRCALASYDRKAGV